MANEASIISFILSVTDVDSVILRMTIIGVLLSFRSLAQEALNDVSTRAEISRSGEIIIFCGELVSVDFVIKLKREY